jgi:hypothetical protein
VVLALLAGSLGVAPAAAVSPRAAQPTPADCTIFVVNGIALGTAGDDVICGTPGDDTILGGGGSDTIFGFGGNDYIDAGAGNDWVDGGAGYDQIVLGPGDDYANGGPDADQLWGDAGLDKLVGGSGNDSLSGGSGKDYVNGGDGVDACPVDKQDTSISCYYDSAKPQLVSVAVATKNVDTSAAAQELALRVHVTDVGTGVRSIHLVFQRHLTNGSWVSDVTFEGDAEHAPCTADNHAASPQPGETTSCLVAGTWNNGIYEMRTQLRHWSAQGTYILSDVRMYDGARNWGLISYDTLTTKHLAVSFHQTGAGDATAPAFRSVQLISPASISTASSAQLVGFRMHLTDAVSGISGISAEVARMTHLDGVDQYYWPQPGVGDNPATVSWCPHGTPSTSQVCRASGDIHDGWYQIWIELPRWAPKGVYELTVVGLSDLAGNTHYYTYGELVTRHLTAKVSQTAAGDSTPPTIVSVTVKTPVVHAGTDWVKVVIQVHARDAVSGISGLFIDFGPSAASTTQALSFASSNEPCSALNEDACLVSGTIRDGTWQLAQWLPAHAAGGVWTMYGATANDNAGNQGWAGPDELKAQHLAASFTNG